LTPELQKSSSEVKQNLSPEILWKRFEKTGSISDYLLYLKKIEASMIKALLTAASR
jgi:hypothetical protein